MDTIPLVHLSDEYVNSLSGRTVYTADSSDLIHMRPPERHEGIYSTMSFLNSIFMKGEEYLSVGSTVGSTDVFAIEIWYVNNTFKFYFYSPTPKLTEIQKRQLDGFFPTCRLDVVESMFPPVKTGDVVAGADIWLRNHFYEPILQPENGVRQWDDPYQMIFNGIHTRDGVNKVIQILFTPAQKSWHTYGSKDMEAYAKSFTEPSHQKRLYGLLDDATIEPTQNEKRYRDSILSQINTPAFHVNIRALVYGDDEFTVTDQLTELTRLLSNGYEEVSEQTLEAEVPESKQDLNDLVRRVAAREPVNMSEPERFVDKFTHPSKNVPNKYLIMSIPEVSGLAHIPQESDLNTDAIKWTESAVTGTLPSEAQTYTPLSYDARVQQLEKWEQERNKINELCDITSSDRYSSLREKTRVQNTPTQD